MIVECPGCRARYDLSGRRIGTRARCRCGAAFVVPRPRLAAEVLQCAACGAPSSPEDSSCSYCRAALAVVACPACFGRVFAGSQHCAHCGAATLVGAKADPELIPVRACSRCSPSNELSPRWVAETRFDECTRCGGVWIESLVLESLVKNRELQAQLEAVAIPELVIEPSIPASSETTSPSASRREYIPCPDCRQLMNRQNFAGISGVIVDLCKPHGMWFDQGELGRLVKFIASGGLIDARRREIEQLEREARQKRTEARAIPLLSESIETKSRAGWIGEFIDALFQLLH